MWLMPRPRMDMLSFFQPVVDKIIKLLKDQIRRSENEHNSCRINTVLLVGGFGDSLYLLEVIKSWCKKNGDIRVLCPPTRKVICHLNNIRVTNTPQTSGDRQRSSSPGTGRHQTNKEAMPAPLWLSSRKPVPRRYRSRSRSVS
jgi:hypothetical protein